VKYKITATKGSQTVGFVVDALGLGEALEKARAYIEQETGISQEQLDDLRVIQQDKESSATRAADVPDVPGQGYIPGTEPAKK